MAYTKEERAWIWLSSVYGIGGRRFDALMAEFGTPEAVWREYGPAMEELLDKPTHRELGLARSVTYVDRLFAELEADQVQVVIRGSENYPPLLAQIADPPPVLFVRGSTDLTDLKTFAIVGARNCTRYGESLALEIAEGLAAAGVTIVSGLARGVDSAAHQGALLAKGRTIGVLGCGVDVVYPPENAQLYEEIIGSGGSIISEYRPGTKAHGKNFPARNRIISGICAGMLLVEAAAGSGALITVEYALEQNREVFALPGPVTAQLSHGPNRLIREGARLATSAADILEDLQWPHETAWMHGGDVPTDTPAPTTLVSLTDDEKRVYEALRDGEVGFDALVERLNISAGGLNSVLTTLELKGIIKQLPGRVYGAAH